MGYFTIKNFYVFYTDERFENINKPFIKTLTAHEAIEMRILNMDGSLNENALKLQKLQTEKLNEDFKNLEKEDFINKWVYFEFNGIKAQQVSWELIYDYFIIHGNGIIQDLRDMGSKIIDDYKGKGFSFPQGDIVGLKFVLVSTGNFYKRLFNTGNTITRILNLRKIEKIKGTLNDLEIETDSELLRLSKNIEFSAKP